MRRLKIVEAVNFLGDDAHLSEEAIALYVDALKLQKVYLLPGAVLGHVEDCQECKSEIVEALSSVQERATGAIEPHPYFSKNAYPTPSRFSLPYRIAAVFFIGISIGILFYLFRSMKDNKIVATDTMQTVQITHPEIRKSPTKDNEAIQQNILADNFSESPNLEDLVSSASRSESPLVASPKNNAVLSQPIVFEWKVQEGGVVSVTILSNREDLITSVRLKQSKFLFSGKLNPGLYYWKLEREDELLYVGKFFVK